MGLFRKDEKFIRLVEAIDKRYKLYEKLLTEGSEPHPAGLKLICQEFRNLKVKAWDIEKGERVSDLIKELHEDDVKVKLGGINVDNSD